MIPCHQRTRLMETTTRTTTSTLTLSKIGTEKQIVSVLPWFIINCLYVGVKQFVDKFYTFCIDVFESQIIFLVRVLYTYALLQSIFVSV